MGTTIQKDLIKSPCNISARSVEGMATDNIPY